MNDCKEKEEYISIEKCLDNLRVWKEYPNFKAESRVDWILALAIPTLLEQKFKSKCKLILPEFPLSNNILHIQDDNTSKKVDYYCLLQNGEHYLVELKTDINSLDENQIDYLKKAEEIGVYKILEGLINIKNNSASKKKYEEYFKELQKANLIDSNDNIDVSKNKKFNIICIVPNKNHIKLKNFNTFKSNEFILFELKDLCDILKKSDSEFLKGLSEIVESWK